MNECERDGYASWCNRDERERHTMCRSTWIVMRGNVLADPGAFPCEDIYGACDGAPTIGRECALVFYPRDSAGDWTGRRVFLTSSHDCKED